MEQKNTLTNRVIKGLFWVTLGKGARAILQLIVVMILARLIMPEHFGVVSAAMIVVGFSEVFTELGLGAALIQREELEQRHISTASFASLAMSIAVGAVIWFIAPLLETFFASDQVGDVLRVLAVLFPLNGLHEVPESLAQRDMRFRWLAKRDTVCFSLGYFVFGVGMALYGFGVWALVAATISSTAIKTAMLLWAYPPKSFVPDMRSVRELMYFGGGHTIARLTNYMALQGDNLVVGRFLGVAALGIYGRAYQLMSVPASIFGQILDKVLFPSMAKMQSDKERLGEAYMRGVGLVALVMLPASVVGFILAPEIVTLMLGDKWSEVVLPFRILTIGLLMRTSYKLSDSLARATGAVYRRAWRQTMYAALVIGGASIFSFWGLPGVAVGVLLAVTVNFLFMAHLSLDLTGKRWGDLMLVHKHALAASAVVGACVYPFVVLLREVGSHPAAVLAVIALLLMVMGFLMIRFAPNFFLGAEGVWVLNILQEYIPAQFRFKLSGTDEKPLPPVYGVKDANIENA